MKCVSMAPRVQSENHVCPTVHRIFDCTVRKSEKLRKTLQKNRIIKKLKDQKCEILSAATELDESNRTDRTYKQSLRHMNIHLHI